MIYKTRIIENRDIEDIDSLLKNCFSGKDYDDGYIMQLEWIISNGDRDYLICADDPINNDLIGFAHGEINEDIGNLEYIAVDRSYRKCGVGKALMFEMAYRLGSRGADRIILTPTKESEKFYRALGFGMNGRGKMIAEIKDILRKVPY